MDIANYLHEYESNLLRFSFKLTGNEYIELLKRFISRRGARNSILSDNGKSFISEDVQNFAASKNIVWKFNLKSAPWQGGFSNA